MITGTAYSRYHKQFIAQYEFRNYPFYATQYHIEKTVFENNKTNSHLSRNPELIKFDFEFISAVFEPTRKYGIARSNLPKQLIGRLIEHQRPRRGIFTFFQQMYYFRRRINDKWLKRTFQKQIYEYWRLRRMGIKMREVSSLEHDNDRFELEDSETKSRRLEEEKIEISREKLLKMHPEIVKKQKSEEIKLNQPLFNKYKVINGLKIAIGLLIVNGVLLSILVLKNSSVSDSERLGVKF